MCGIVGYVGERDALPILIDCLRRLEYRGYDSAGVAVMQDGRLEIRRSQGKVARLETALRSEPLQGRIGLAHTRWATHGVPSDRNAHPHTDCPRSLAVVHNGIIENHLSLRKVLETQGHALRSETDSEIVAHLIESANGVGLEVAAARAARDLKGAYALGILSQKEPGKLVALRNGGPPLVVGIGGDGLFLASDIAAILAYTRDVLVLEDREMAVLSGDGVRIVTFDGRPVRRERVRVPWNAEAAEKNGYPHFMLKEIHDQPRGIEDTFRGLIDAEAGEVDLPDVPFGRGALGRIRRIFLVACGTSWHAALVGKHLLEGLCRIPVEVDIGSEFRYRDPIADETTLTVAVSQSGETADTLGALREARERGSRTLAICNVVGSSLSREAEGVIFTRAGPEIGVASTKAFTTQLVALLLLSIHLGRRLGRVSPEQGRRLLAELLEAPQRVQSALETSSRLADLAGRFCERSSFLYLGRGILHPLALEGALKLKEISYIHAEGYAAGEMKHGPIALIDRTMPVVAIAPLGRLYDKTLGNIEEVKAREGVVIALASEGDARIATLADHVVCLPRASELFQPILAAVPLQLLAYHMAVRRGCDVDQPRNLAKSVTVE